MLSANNDRYRILIADDDIEQGEEICDLIYRTVSLFPVSIGVSRDQLDINVISKVSEVDSELAHIRQNKNIPYNIILSDIFMPLNDECQPPSIEGGWLKFYNTISDISQNGHEVTSELLLIAITNKCEDAIRIRKIIRDENQKSSLPWVDFLHKPDKPVFQKPSGDSELLNVNSWTSVIQAAIEKYRDLCWRNTFIKCDLDTLLPASTVFSEIRSKISEFREQRIILLIGEDGTEKTKIAQYLYRQRSPERDANKKYQQLHCSSIPISQIKAKIVGIEKGAVLDNYTFPQPKTETGLLERSQDGVVFIDGIDNSPEITTAIDMIISELISNNWSYHRIGGTVNSLFEGTLVIGASSLGNLNYSNNRGKAGFSRELFHKIEPYTISIPPLKKRRLDILSLADKFINIDKHQGDPRRVLEEDAQKILLNYSWPGNIAELESLMKKVSSQTKLITKINAEIISECLPDKKHSLGNRQQFKKWENPPVDTCFVISKDNRVQFRCEDQCKNLGLMRNSQAETLILHLAFGPATSQVIKTLFPGSKTKANRIVKDVNAALNKKMVICGFSQVPKDIDFIVRDKDMCHYMAIFPIITPEDLWK